MTACKSVSFFLSLFAFTAIAQVVEVPRAPRHERGNVNVVPVQPIDEAAWIWASGPVVWGVAADVDVWKVNLEEGPDESEFVRFRCQFTADSQTARFDVSADERYVLYLDGAAVARGPVRGMVEHWYYHTYEMRDLAPGPHVLEAVVSRLGVRAPVAQLSYRGGFILKAEGDYDARLTTGKAKWLAARLRNTTMTGRGLSDTFGCGTQCRAIGCGFGDEVPTQWQPAVVARDAVDANPYGGRTKGWMLYPADRPAMRYEVKTPGRIKAVRTVGDPLEYFADEDAASPKVARFNALLRGERIVIPPRAALEVAWDLENYYCAYPELTISDGKGASVSWGWAEALCEGKEPQPARNKKVNRSAFIGLRFAKYFADEFISDGRTNAHFTAPWWRCGRWCRLLVKTADEPLTIDRVAIGETGYPLALDGSFACDDAELMRIGEISQRTLQCCVHDLTFDCPYYEQQMYPGDTRVQLDVLNRVTRDDRMAKFAMAIFDHDRRDNGLVAMNFPTRGTQESATYTMCWLMMFKDYMYCHDDAAFLRQRMPGANATLMGLALYENGDGLLENLPGWSFVDWVSRGQRFANGCAPDGAEGVSALNNLQYLLAIRSVAAVEEALNEKELAAYWSGKARRLAAAIRAKFMASERGILSDTLDRMRFSEHAQALAILSDMLNADETARALSAMESGKDLALASSYFSYYLFRAYAKCQRADLIMKKLDFWRGFLEWGAKTTFETQYIHARSDCHAWCACPLYAYHAAFAGVTSASPFFKSVRIAPQPAGLKHIRAKTPCPAGLIETDLTFKDGRAVGTVVLPKGLDGVFEYGDITRFLTTGANEVW